MRRFFIAILFLLIPVTSFATTRALQFDILLTPIIDYRTFAVASGYTVYFYSAGTSTAKNVWTEKEKTNPYTSRTLDSDGTTQVYGDGVYKLIIKDTDTVTVYEWDNVKVQANTYTVQTKAGTYTATAEDDLILVDATSGDRIINMSTVAGFTHPIAIKLITGSNTVTVNDFSGELFDASDETIVLTTVDDNATLYPDIDAGTWRRVNRLSGLTATVSELNQLDGVEVGGDASGDILTIYGTQTTWNKTVESGVLNSGVLNTGVSGSAISVSGTLVENSDTLLASQQAVKEYADSIGTTAATAYNKMLAVDGTAGRVLRSCELQVTYNVNASIADIELADVFNGDAIAKQNCTKGGAAQANIALSAAGETVTIAEAGVTGSAVAIMANMQYNYTETNLSCAVSIQSGGLRFDFYNGAGSAHDLASIASGDIVYILVWYITSS